MVKCPAPVRGGVSLLSTRTDAHIDGVIADVVVRQTYVNSGSQTLEAVYVFPGSTRAAVYGMEMKVGSRTVTARAEEREKARRDYEHANREGKTVGLLEQQRPNVFQMNVANILPGDTIAVTMRYTELLEYRDGLYEFAYPGAVGPRYTEGREEWVGRSVGQPVSEPSHFDVAVTVKAGVPLQSVKCPSHQINVTRTDDRNTAVSLANPRDRQGNRDFILQYGLSGGAVRSGMMCYDRGDEKFFLLMAQPPQKTAVEDIPPREYIFIVDVSGSMNGFPLEVSKALLRNLIGSLRPADVFNVVLFESERSILSERSLPATPANIAKATAVIDNAGGFGGTRLLPALQTAFDFPATPDFTRTFIIATDGYVTVEAEAFRMVRERRNRANLFALGIGTSVNRHLIEGLAYAGAGEAYFITSQTEAETVGKKLRNDVSAPVLSHISVNWGGFDAYDVEPSPAPDLFAARPVIIYGKYRGTPRGAVTLKGRTAAGEYVQTVNAGMAERTSSEALRYLWARNRVKYLSDYAAFFADDVKVLHPQSDKPALEQQIIDLGLKYNLLTRYTSFLAVDDRVRTPLPQSAPAAPPAPMHFSQSLSIVSDDVAPLMEVAEEEEEEVFTIVEDMPLFAGGRLEDTFRKWVAENLRYPEYCQQSAIQGRVIVQFTIDRNGRLTDVKVIRGVHPMLDAEAVRVLSASPGWTPGKQRGKPVAVKYVFPVSFKLEAATEPAGSPSHQE
jgi:Ca-activated chloride channel family protein